MKVYLVGDSTVCEYEGDYNDLTLRNGYGMRVKEYLKGIETVNLALSGRSSRSFLTEDNYPVLVESLEKGDYLVIGFGHNDQKKDERFSDPTLGEDDPTSFKHYLYNYYIKLAFDRGAVPIICTPIARLRDDFDYTGVGGHVTTTDGAFAGGDYPAVIRSLAVDKGVTLIDMTARTIELYKSLPLNVTFNLFADDTKKPGGVDHTHLNGYGARHMAYIFCSELVRTDNPLKDYVDTDKLVKPEIVIYRKNMI